jgi:hypothetical protein
VSSRRFHRRAILIAATVLLLAVSGSLVFLRVRHAGALVQVPFSDLLRHVERGVGRRGQRRHARLQADER